MPPMSVTRHALILLITGVPPAGLLPGELACVLGDGLPPGLPAAGLPALQAAASSANAPITATFLVASVTVTSPVPPS